MIRLPKKLHLALTKALKRTRWHDQGGYPGYLGDGKWSGQEHGLWFSTKDLKVLFEAVGIEPDVIVSLGRCEDCKHSKVYADGSRGEQGYAGPCLPCKRPRMSNFVPLRRKP